jgi:hypothetical protein
MVRDDQLRERLRAAKNDMAALLASDEESCTGKRPYTFPS